MLFPLHSPVQVHRVPDVLALPRVQRGPLAQAKDTRYPAPRRDENDRKAGIGDSIPARAAAAERLQSRRSALADRADIETKRAQPTWPRTRTTSVDSSADSCVSSVP
jgi:hypothetical protein